MDYSRIKEVAKIKKIPLEEVAKAAGMSATGFHQAIKNNSMRIEALEQIADFLGVKVSVFFEKDDIKNAVSEGVMQYASNIGGGNQQQASYTPVGVRLNECLDMLNKSQKETIEWQRKAFELQEVLRSKGL